ncbi:MAG: hypothetical protein H6823_27360 [Planctomycetaceae bacterium]|nr:hypothetical protein [Planctomycetaceae bacterium]
MMSFQVAVTLRRDELPIPTSDSNQRPYPVSTQLTSAHLGGARWLH